MTKNLNNAMRPERREDKASLSSKIAPALFPLVVVVLGYVIGRLFFGL